MAQININGLLGNDGPNYSEIIVRPYRDELLQAGFEQLLSVADVDRALGRTDDQTQLVVLNSVCGCSARVGRPGAILSLVNNRVPDLLFTLFAGMEKEAVGWFRQNYLSGLTPSSPNIALFKNGQMLHILHRHQIERMTASEIAAELSGWYDESCTKQLSVIEESERRKYFTEKYQADPLDLPTE
jgi:putative YphP/YqiW family bacilliredoxin